MAIEKTIPINDTTMHIPVGISACLLGQKVRYNGGHSRSKFCLNQLSQHFDFKTFCPEVVAGFGIPRPTMRLIGDPDNPKLVYSDNMDTDLTGQLTAGFKAHLDSLSQLDGYILMKNSPSCGMERIKIYQESGYAHERRGQGLFTQALIERYPLLPVEEEGRLHDPNLCENFILRVFAFHRFRHEVLSKPSIHALLTFHSRYKYVVMAQNQVYFRQLGQMLSTPHQKPLDVFLQDYLKLFMHALSKPATRKNHTHTLLHILGYLKKTAPSEARQHIADIIHRYRQELLPLIVPITLLRHYIDQTGNDYIRSQRYLQPYPDDLRLRNEI